MAVTQKNLWSLVQRPLVDSTELADAIQNQVGK